MPESQPIPIRRAVLTAIGALLGALGLTVFAALRSPIQPIPFTTVAVPEAFRTTGEHGESDSIAIYRSPDGKHNWMFVTDKHGNRIQVFDAATGTHIRDFGTTGSGPGQFNRPNGIAVWQITPGTNATKSMRVRTRETTVSTIIPAFDDALLFVVERDGKRVQAFTLPNLEPYETIGFGDLTKPYGVAVTSDDRGYPELYITDNSRADTTRVRKYVIVGLPKLAFAPDRTFGDDSGPGLLRLVESIAVDPEYRRLYVCDEHHRRRNVKVYATNTRRFLGTFADGFVTDDPEGIAVWREGRTGWIILTNQGKETSTFHVFDRATLAHVGAFVGKPNIANTDGIAVTQGTLGHLAGGAMYAIDNDGPVIAYSWRDIAIALKLPSSATQPPATSGAP